MRFETTQSMLPHAALERRHDQIQADTGYLCNKDPIEPLHNPLRVSWFFGVECIVYGLLM